MQRLVLTAAALAGSLSLAGSAHAKQFVVADATYTHSAQTTQDSHYKVEPSAETPDDWTSPVDYANGSVHVRLEVKTKPSNEPTRFQICFEMKVNYNCTDQVQPYTAPGVYEWDTDVQKGYRPGPVDFTQGIERTALILKDTKNVKPAPENVGEATAALYLPSDLRVTVTVVAAGDEYEPPSDGASPGGSGGGGAGGAAAGATSTGGSASSGSGGANSAGASAGGADVLGNAGAAGSSAAMGGSGPAVVETPSGGASNQPAPGGVSDDAGCALTQSPPRGAVPSLLAGLVGFGALLRRRRALKAAQSSR